MNTAKVYHDIEGNECSIFQMVKREPTWAAVRVQEGEKAIEQRAALIADLDNLVDRQRYRGVDEYWCLALEKIVNSYRRGE